jgi:uncharacterized membrane protein
LVGILGAGFVHVVVLFMLPHFTQKDAWSRLAALADPYQVVRPAAEPGKKSVPGFNDPLFEAAACRFDLSDGAVHVHAPGHIPFWSMSAYKRSGVNVYSLNDRTATERVLDFVIISPTDMLTMRKELPPEFERSIFVEAPIEEGIVVVRAFVPDATWRKRIAGYLDGLSCDPQ